jgi:hypothetical protein
VYSLENEGTSRLWLPAKLLLADLYEDFAVYELQGVQVNAFLPLADYFEGPVAVCFIYLASFSKLQ